MTTKVWGLLRIAVFLGLAGCAGWAPGTDVRNGYVRGFYSSEGLLRNPPACLASLTPGQLVTGQYVEINIHSGRMRRHVSAFVPRSIKLELHDKVEISPSYCTGGAVPEVKRILKRAAPTERPAEP